MSLLNSKSLLRTRISAVVGGRRVCVLSYFFKIYLESSGGQQFDCAYCSGRKWCGGEEKNCENGAHHHGVLIIINRRIYCFGCPSRRRSVSRRRWGRNRYYIMLLKPVI
uniref:Uncharacterized protein n=1 Tax=Schizaphis graminum TaxID=13262 RepID=A0A2S2NDK5_SCHGA